MKVFSSRPRPRLAAPHGVPNVWGGKNTRYSVKYWWPTHDRAGKVEVLTDSSIAGVYENDHEIFPDLVMETQKTLEFQEHPGMRALYKVVGATAMQHVKGRFVLQEVMVPPVGVVNETLQGLNCGVLPVEQFWGGSIPDTYLMRKLAPPHPESPAVAAAVFQVFAAHDLLGHVLPAWAFVPVEAARPIGESCLRKIEAGVDPSRQMFALDQRISFADYGGYVLHALQHPNEPGYWDDAANRLNDLAGGPIVSGQRVAQHVHGLHEAARAHLRMFSDLA